MKKIIIPLLILFIAFTSCRYHSYRSRHISGSGSTRNESRPITGFTGVETNGDIELVLQQGTFNVRVEADENILQYIETVVQDGRLLVRFRNDISIGDYNTARVYITAPSFAFIESNGSGNIRGEGKLQNNNSMEIGVSGSGDIKLTVDCPLLKTFTHGSGELELNGESRSIESEITGSGDLKLSDLKAESVKVMVHGSGDSEVYASESLEAEISGSGSVHYRGDPKITSSIHGSGDVSRMD